MRCIIYQQGSGSRILAGYYGGFVEHFFEDEPTPTEEQATEFLANKPDVRLAYNHLEEQPWLYELLKDYEIIHLYRDPARTFTRNMAKYKEVKSWTREDLIEYIGFVKSMRQKVNESFKNVTIIHYEDFIRDLYLGEIMEYNHL